MTYTTYQRLIFRQLSDFTNKNNVLNGNISAYWKGQSFTTSSYSRCHSKSYEAFGTKYDRTRLKVTGNDVIISNTFQVDLQVRQFYPVIWGHKSLLLQEASYFPEKKVDSATYKE